MRVGLFIPCYIDQCYPNVGLATVEVLRRCGVEPEYPREQTCCGQPMANSGCVEAAKPVARHFAQTFAPYDYVVGPSGSCVSMIRNHYDDLLDNQAERQRLSAKTFELCEFLVDVLKVDRIEGRFPHRVGLHQSCHGLRELGLARQSELGPTAEPQVNKVRTLLEGLDGIKLVDLQRSDECCGFGGTFAVKEAAVSCLMGRDRIADHVQAGAEVMTAGDMSCLMHLQGLMKRDGTPMRVMHVAEILAASNLHERLTTTSTKDHEGRNKEQMNQ